MIQTNLYVLHNLHITLKHPHKHPQVRMDVFFMFAKRFDLFGHVHLLIACLKLFRILRTTDVPNGMQPRATFWPLDLRLLCSNLWFSVSLKGVLRRPFNSWAPPFLGFLRLLSILGRPLVSLQMVLTA